MPLLALASLLSSLSYDSAVLPSGRAVAQIAHLGEEADAVSFKMSHVRFGPFLLEDQYRVRRLKLTAPEGDRALHLTIYGGVFVDTDSIDIYRLDLKTKTLKQVFATTTRGEVTFFKRHGADVVLSKWSLEDPWFMPDERAKGKYLMEYIWFDKKTSDYVSRRHPPRT